MRALSQRGLVEVLRGVAASGKPLLCVCLGLQLLMDVTQEGDAPCLGIVAGTTKKLPDGLKIPHMGWNQVRVKKDHPLIQDIPDGSYFYFVHSYYADPTDRNTVAGVTEYGVSFCSIMTVDNVMATQFHPEKSGTLGLMLYRNFVTYASKYSKVHHGTGAS